MERCVCHRHCGDDGQSRVAEMCVFHVPSPLPTCHLALGFGSCCHTQRLPALLYFLLLYILRNSNGPRASLGAPFLHVLTHEFEQGKYRTDLLVCWCWWKDRWKFLLKPKRYCNLFLSWQQPLTPKSCFIWGRGCSIITKLENIWMNVKMLSPLIIICY